MQPNNVDLDHIEDQDPEQDHAIDAEDIAKVTKQLHELTCQQRETDFQLRRLKASKKELLESLPEKKEQGSHYDDIPHYILPLVEDVYWLELKEKAMKEEYKKELIMAEGRQLGQELLRDSLSPDECVLKRWYEELIEMSMQQQDLLSIAACKDKTASVHNISYKTNLSDGIFLEVLSFSVFCETVSVGIKVKSHLPYCSKHFISFTTANVCAFSDIHIPDLEDKVTQGLEDVVPISDVISLVKSYIASDIAPFVIGMPLKRKKKKKVEMKPSDMSASRTITESLAMNATEDPRIQLISEEPINL